MNAMQFPIRRAERVHEKTEREGLDMLPSMHAPSMQS